MSGAIPSTMMDQPLVLPEILRHAELYHPGRQIHSRSADGIVTTTTYAMVAERSRRLASRLTALGIKPGDRVATLALNSARHMEVYFAVAGMGAVYHTLNPRLSLEQASFVVGHAEDRIVFFDPHLAGLVEQFRPKMPTVEHWIALGPDQLDVGGEVLAYEDLVDAGASDFSWPDIDERSAAALCYTSGTTGNPKGVLYSHRALVVQALAAALPDAENISARDTILVVVPMFHVNGWGLPYSGALTGAGLVMPGPQLDGRSLFDLMERCGVTLGAAVPTIWQDVALEIERRGALPSALERVINGGSPPPRSLVRFYREHGISMLHGWGMTETTAACTFSAPLAGDEELPEAAQIDRVTSQGRPMFPIRLRIVDPDETPLPHDGEATGQLEVQGLWVTQRYFRGADETVDGWLPTGDIASVDGRGYVRLTDRAKDLIKSGGEWISSAAIESAVLEHPALFQAAVVGAPDALWGERPVLFAVLRPDEQAPELAELQSLVEKDHPRWWAPDRVVWVDAMPLGPTGKILKRRLRDDLSRTS